AIATAEAGLPVLPGEDSTSGLVAARVGARARPAKPSDPPSLPVDLSNCPMVDNGFKRGE
ncbi:MAG: hypothetical protein M3072_08895, partial [Candidatus Dormibacteraeota bacterium]|nr:hypothetical protein [Candidatus Dormibacteraeota bacterium]